MGFCTCSEMKIHVFYENLVNNNLILRKQKFKKMLGRCLRSIKNFICKDIMANMSLNLCSLVILTDCSC